MATIFDRESTFKRLNEAGYTEPQAQALAEILDRLVKNNLIAKGRFFDTYASFKKLRDAGLTELQAETFIQILRELISI